MTLKEWENYDIYKPISNFGFSKDELIEMDKNNQLNNSLVRVEKKLKKDFLEILKSNNNFLGIGYGTDDPNFSIVKSYYTFLDFNKVLDFDNNYLKEFYNLFEFYQNLGLNEINFDLSKIYLLTNYDDDLKTAVSSSWFGRGGVKQSVFDEDEKDFYNSFCFNDKIRPYIEYNVYLKSSLYELKNIWVKYEIKGMEDLFEKIQGFKENELNLFNIYFEEFQNKIYKNKIKNGVLLNREEYNLNFEEKYELYKSQILEVFSFLL